MLIYNLLSFALVSGQYILNKTKHILHV